MIDVKEVGPGRFELRMRCGTGPRKRYVFERPSKAAALIWAARMGAIRDLFVAAGSPEACAVALQLLAEQRTETGFDQVEARSQKLAAKAALAEPEPAKEKALARTFAEFARLLLAGELQRLWPQHIRALRPATQTTYTHKLEAICKISVPHDGRRVAFGSLPLVDIGRPQADAVLAAMHERGSTSGLQSGRILGRLMRLAVEPCRLVERFPFEKGWLPMRPARPAFSYLFPTEEALLMGCPGIPLEERLYFGLLAREGMRSEEAAGMLWTHLDLVAGDFRLDDNKTGLPRTWKLGEDVAEALRLWRERCREQGRPTGPDDLVFHLEYAPKDRSDRLRQCLRLAGVTRSVLFERNPRRRPLRLHDLRGTFVTLALALGHTEDWVTARTGHKSTLQLALYRRAVANCREHHLGWLCPLTHALSTEPGGPLTGPNAVTIGNDFVSEYSDKTSPTPTPIPTTSEIEHLGASDVVNTWVGPPDLGGAGQKRGPLRPIDPALFDALLARVRDGGFEALTAPLN